MNTWEDNPVFSNITRLVSLKWSTLTIIALDEWMNRRETWVMTVLDVTQQPDAHERNTLRFFRQQQILFCGLPHFHQLMWRILDDYSCGAVASLLWTRLHRQIASTPPHLVHCRYREKNFFGLTSSLRQNDGRRRGESVQKWTKWWHQSSCCRFNNTAWSIVRLQTGGGTNHNEEIFFGGK